MVSYIDQDGNTQKAISYYVDQVQQTSLSGRAVLQVLNEDMTPKLDEKNKPVKVLKKTEALTIIGYTD